MPSVSSSMSEKLCLQWNDFKDNINSTFGSLREDVDFSDVTLVSEDGQQVGAHKVILAASSPFFQNLLKRNKHHHPLVFMRGVKFDNLLAIVDFLYLGQTKIFQEHLDAFLTIAEELQLKGLMGLDKSGDGEVMENMAASKPTYPKQVFKRESQVSKDPANVDGNKSRNYDADETIALNIKQTIALTADFSGDLQELEEKVKSLMEKTPNATADGQRKLYVCKVCGKEGQSIHVKRHIESQHLDGFSHPCDQCDKICRNRDALRSHKRRVHGKEMLSV